MAIVTVPRVLRERLGDEGVDSWVDLINRADQRAKEDTLTFVEEKFERRLAEEIGKVNQRISEETAKVNQRISEGTAKLYREIAETRSGLRSEIANAKADLIRWMFIFWVGQTGVILGMPMAFFRR